MSGLVQWGESIRVNGVRPAWLKPSEQIMLHTNDGSPSWYGKEVTWYASEILPSYKVDVIRLPSDHFAYRAIAAGYEPWGGGDSAPEDWDGGDVLWDTKGQGTVDRGFKQATHPWNPTIGWYDIIGYRKRTTSAPTTDDGDYVRVKRMTEGDAREWHREYCEGSIMGAMLVLKALGLIREPTTAERIATRTGIPASDVEQVLAALKEYGE